MGFVAELSAAVVLIGIVYWWFKNVNTVRNKLRWCVKKPGVPILGNALEFTGGSTEHLKTIGRCIEYSKEKKFTYIEFVYRPIILISNYKFLEFVLSSNSLKLIDKSDDYTYLVPWLGTGLLTSGGGKWKTRRRILTPAFHFQILEQFVEVFESNGNIMVNRLKEEVDKNSFDIYPYITLCTLDIICETAMGVSINAQDKKESEYVRSVKEMCRIIVERSFSPIEMFDTLFPLSRNYKIQNQAIKVLHNNTYSVIRQRRKELEESKKQLVEIEDDVGTKKRMAFLDLLLKATVDNKPLSNEDIREEVDTFMFEGHDTTASAISFAIYLLANHPEEQKKAYEELNLIFADDKNRPTGHRYLQEMKYLENVIKETLRLYPSVPFYARMVNEDIEYEDGKVIPKDTSLVIFAYGVNRDKDNFKDPDSFIPSRFDGIDGKSPYSYLPFSAGPRNCIGQKFAMLEMKSTISKIIRNYELLPSIPEHKIVLAAETVLKSANGIKIRIKKR
ncbi:unnamed protein product [Brassicogethes aeneus]|uniref:Cytochrome P450 n=1 Tax=Brassicogethes aeneus TaxID=1431903 RepID=A0A9P0B8H6_BRAAE|nr:unnamed protein product [Brassicogethes aeneus]